MSRFIVFGLLLCFIGQACLMTKAQAGQEQKPSTLELIKGYPKTLYFQNTQRGIPLLFNQSIDVSDLKCEYRGSNLCLNGKLQFPSSLGESKVEVLIKFKNVPIGLQAISLVLGNKQTLLFRPLLFPKQMARNIPLSGLPDTAVASSIDSQLFSKTNMGWSYNLSILNTAPITSLFEENGKKWEVVILSAEAKKTIIPKTIRARSRATGKEEIIIEKTPTLIESLSWINETFWDSGPLPILTWGQFKQKNNQFDLTIDWDNFTGDNHLKAILALSGEGIDYVYRLDLGLFDDHIQLPTMISQITINSGQAFSAQSPIPNLFNTNLRAVKKTDLASGAGLFFPAEERIQIVNPTAKAPTLQFLLLARPDISGQYNEMLVLTFDNGDKVEIPIKVNIQQTQGVKKLKLSIYLPQDSGMYANVVKNLIQAQTAMKNIISPIVVGVDEVPTPIEGDTFDYSNPTHAKLLEDNFDIRSEGFPVWYFPKVKEDEGREVGGFTYLASKRAMTFITVSSSTRGTTLTHELGHALGLPHTFEYAENPLIQICHLEGDLCVVSEDERKLSGRLISPIAVTTPWGNFNFLGDGIDDTPFDPGINASFFPQKCYTDIKFLKGQTSTKFVCPQAGVAMVVKGHELNTKHATVCSEKEAGIECVNGWEISPFIQNNYMSYWQGRNESGDFSPQQINLMKKNIQNKGLSFHKYVD